MLVDSETARLIGVMVRESVCPGSVTRSEKGAEIARLWL